jgi:hypothetical protein
MKQHLFSSKQERIYTGEKDKNGKECIWCDIYAEVLFKEPKQAGAYIYLYNGEDRYKPAIIMEGRENVERLIQWLKDNLRFMT